MLGRGLWEWLLALLLASCAPAVAPDAVPPDPSGPASAVPSPAAGALVPDSEGVLVRIEIHDRFGGGRLSLEADGRVVLVHDSSVLATRDAFVTWTVTPRALARASSALGRTGILEAEPGDFGEGSVQQGSRSVGIFRDPMVISASEESPRFPPVWRAVRHLADPAWWGDGLVSGPEPFVPDEISLVFSPPEDANPYPMATWPFDETIEQMGEPATGLPGELAVCLRGDDAARLWASLPSGQVGVFRWADGSATWSARVDVTTPGYRLYGGGCDPV